MVATSNKGKASSLFQILGERRCNLYASQTSFQIALFLCGCELNLDAFGWPIVQGRVPTPVDNRTGRGEDYTAQMRVS